MMLLRFAVIGMFSFTAISILAFQSIEAIQAFIDLAKKK
ncbi:hypothetical protein KP78_35540 [Jeotgalibacillus soli]|uniref:Uncharacterized protein n=1 Tax=Jeotgalibacillus soli TaxID=889306 RepID=A0A0C2R2V9_9BACL|nr:hypothetical protein KP78_35540 [Jeotgalibacillus soli]